MEPESESQRPEPPADPVSAGLAVAVREIESWAAGQGWDGPVRLFALVRTAALLEREPGLATQLEDEAAEHHLTSIEQEGLPAAEDLEDLLLQLGWPAEVDGAAVVVERVIVGDDDPDLTADEALGHPEREDVRMAVGVLRSGENWCAVRLRRHDDDAFVISAPNMVPGLVEALRLTLEAG